MAQGFDQVSLVYAEADFPEIVSDSKACCSTIPFLTQYSVTELFQHQKTDDEDRNV